MGRSSVKEQEAASVASLLGKKSVSDALALAVAHFRALPLRELTKAEMDTVWKRFDKDDSGRVDFNEFMSFVTTDIRDEAAGGGEVEAGAGTDASGSREWLKVNTEACRSDMTIVKSKLKAYSHKGEYGGMASRANWNW